MSEEEVQEKDEESSQTKETNTRDLKRFMEASSQPDEYIYTPDEISTIFSKKPQPKQYDPRNLSIPFFIGEVNIEVDFCDFD
jgi:hypothetical protein